MNRVFALRSGLNITLNINGAISMLSFPTEEEAIALFAEVNRVKLYPTEDNISKLLEFVDPSFKSLESGILERDRVGNYFLKGYNVPMPFELVQKVKQYHKEGLPLTALENFWKLCMMNPDDRTRKDLFNFADQFHFPITDSGYFIAYKSVAGINMKHKDFGIYVAQEYVQMVSAMQENPKDFIVIRTGENPNETSFSTVKTVELDKWYQGMLDENCDAKYSQFSCAIEWMNENYKIELAQVSHALSDDELLAYAKKLGFIEVDLLAKLKANNFITEMGTLSELFLTLNQLFEQEGKSFTDWHSRTMTIRLGEVVSMDREKCDSDPNSTCSTGLHVGAPKYVTDFYKHENQFILAVLVNPAHVCAVPTDYAYQKMRCSEYYPYAICEVSDTGFLKELKTPYFEANYCGYELTQLEADLKETQRVINETINLSAEEQVELETKSALIVNRLFLIGDAAIKPDIF